jgi:hypothetical protein
MPAIIFTTILSSGTKWKSHPLGVPTTTRQAEARMVKNHAWRHKSQENINTEYNKFWYIPPPPVVEPGGAW